MSVTEKVEAISTDFAEQNEPFDAVKFPEERLLETLTLDTDEDKLQAISLFSTLDYNRDANQLVDKILELRDSNLLNPEYVSSNEEYVRKAFDDVALRYRNRDADAWIKNCGIITDKYNGEWSILLADVGFNAPTLVARLECDDFNVLKGVKVAPMYARIINDDVAPLSNVWDLDIPVDTHIERLSRDLFDDPDMSHDEIRAGWRKLAHDNDIDRQVVDGALWHIGNKWNDWGEDYWDSL